MNVKFRVRCLLEYLLLVGFIQTGLAAQENADHIDVPFVPTPITVVDEMLKIAAVDSEDTLYDLGCGDGRIVIRAAQKTGTPGVGVDIDSIRIDEAWYYAEVAGVAGRVQFHQQDLLQTDLSDATVVTLYLLPEMNFILFPKLFKQLSPGARIVSHDFSMGQWMPDSSTVVFGEYETHMVYLWIIPENVTGHWNWRDPIRDGQKELPQ